MFKHVLAQPPKKKRPRSIALLLFVALMMTIATLAFIYDLQRGREPVPGDDPVEVIFLEEEDEEPNR